MKIKQEGEKWLMLASDDLPENACLPEAILVSVGHRSSLMEFHTQVLELLGDGKWRLHDALAD